MSLLKISGYVLAGVAVALIPGAIAVAIIGQQWLLLGAAIAAGGFLTLSFTRPLLALLAWLVSAPVLDLYVKIPLGAGIPDVTFTRGVIVAILFVLLLRSTLGLRALHPIGKVEKFMLAFSALAAASVFFTQHRTLNFQVLLDGYIIPFAVFFLAKNLMTSDKDIGKFFWALAILGFHLAFVGGLQFLTHTDFFTVEGRFVEHLNRAHGPFPGAVQYGAVTVLCLLACLYLITAAKPGAWRPLLIMGLGLIGMAVFASMTRAVWLSAVAALVLVARYVKRTRVIVISLGVLACAGLAFALLQSDFTAFRKRATEINPIESRIVLYSTAVRTIVRRPVLGYGFGRYTFYEAGKEHLAAIGGAPEETAAGLTLPHNELLHILVLMGGLGLFLYLGIFVSSLQSSQALCARSEDTGQAHRSLAVFYWSFLVVYLTNALFVDMLFYGFLTSMVFAFAGLIEGRRLAALPAAPSCDVGSSARTNDPKMRSTSRRTGDRPTAG